MASGGAEKTLAILVTARDLASKALKGVNRELDTMGSKAGKIASQGLKTAASNVKKLAAAGAGLSLVLGAAGVRAGVESLASLEDAVSAVDGAISQLGLTGQVTGSQIATWANQIEGDVQAAFDDKDITAATEGLIRYGHIAAANIQPAMVIMTDLAAKTGDVQSASDLLAKAMADPAKAAGKLARVGVVLTDEQQAQIKAMVKAGKTAEAQAALLDALSQSTKGAAAASKGPARDALNLLNDTIEDVTRAMGTGFLPLITRVSDKLRTKLADPKVMTAIETFGRKLADGFEKALDFAEKVPWGSIGTGLGVAADFAGKVVGAFANMPPEAQAAIVALAGLDRLSGGAITGIVGELGKGIIKGVLGMNAAVVNINAGAVNAGGVPGAATGTAGTATAASSMGVATVLGPAAFAAILVGIEDNKQKILSALFKDTPEAIRPTGNVIDDWTKLITAISRPLDELKTSFRTDQGQTEALLRANLNRPIPAPVVNVAVSTSVSVSDVWGAKMQTMYAGVRSKTS